MIAKNIDNDVPMLLGNLPCSHKENRRNRSQNEGPKGRRPKDFLRKFSIRLMTQSLFEKNINFENLLSSIYFFDGPMKFNCKQNVW